MCPFQYWNRTGQLRPTTGPARKDGSKGGGIQKYNSLMKNNGKPPKGMYVNHDDLVSLATGPSTQGEQLLKGMDREIVSFKRIVSKIRKSAMPLKLHFFVYFRTLYHYCFPNFQL